MLGIEADKDHTVHAPSRMEHFHTAIEGLCSSGNCWLWLDPYFYCKENFIRHSSNWQF